jgi:hypothetical protein
MSNTRNSKVGDNVLGFLAFILLALPAAFQAVRFSTPWGSNSWQITEWFITYDGGFVRRGLLGGPLRFASEFLDVPPSLIAISISALSWIAMTVLFLRLNKGRIKLYIIFSPLLLGMPIFSNFFIGKDVFQLLIFTVSLLLLKTKISPLKIVIVNFLCCIAVLNHEAFLFFGLPIILITASILNEKKVISWSVVLSFTPVILTSALTLISKGDVQISSLITAGWNDFFANNFPAYCCYSESPSAIGAIGWTTIEGVSLSLSVLSDFVAGFIYVPLLWACTFCFAIFLVGNWGIPKDLRNEFFTVLGIQCFFVAPLFLLGWDFGRWFFFILMTSVIWILLFGNKLDNVVKGISFKSLRFIKLIRLGRPRDIYLFIALFCLAIPRAVWTVKLYIISNPFGANLWAAFNLFFK